MSDFYRLLLKYITVFGQNISINLEMYTNRIIANPDDHIFQMFIDFNVMSWLDT